MIYIGVDGSVQLCHKFHIGSLSNKSFDDILLSHNLLYNSEIPLQKVACPPYCIIREKCYSGHTKTSQSFLDPVIFSLLQAETLNAIAMDSSFSDEQRLRIFLQDISKKMRILHVWRTNSGFESIELTDFTDILHPDVIRQCYHDNENKIFVSQWADIFSAYTSLIKLDDIKGSIVIWGMGGRYHAMRHLFEGRNILAFATNDTRLHGTQFEGRPVIGLEGLGKLDNPVVCVCSFAEHAILIDIRRRYGMSMPVITLWPLEGQSTVPQDIHFVSPEDTQPLNDAQLAHARRICKHIHALVLQREAELPKGIFDADIASGRSNWDATAANDYTYKYARLQKGEAEDISYLRAFTAHFTGNILYGQPEAPWYWQSSFARLTPGYLHELAQKRKEEISLLLPLWEYAVRDIPKKYRFSAPPVLGEIGWLVDGGVVNRDAFAYQERVRILYDANVLAHLERIAAQRGCLRILEIGGGYGAIAHWMLRIFPQCRYTIVDLPESLLFSHLYLSLTRADMSAGIGASAPCNLRFVPNWQVDEVDEPQDIVLNTLSMSEMNEAQVRNYAMRIRDRWLVEGGIFFEQNQDNRSVGMLCATNILAEYFPFRRRIIYDGCTQGNPNIWSVHPLPEGLA